MMFNDELTLIKEKTVVDDIGNQLKEITKKTVLCSVSSLTRNEFYAGATAGFKPQLVFTINGFEYDNEELIEYNDQTYTIIRTYRAKPDRLSNHDILSGDFLEIIAGDKIGIVD